jgi:hypothetical protein
VEGRLGAKQSKTYVGGCGHSERPGGGLKHGRYGGGVGLHAGVWPRCPPKRAMGERDATWVGPG